MDLRLKILPINANAADFRRSCRLPCNHYGKSVIIKKVKVNPSFHFILYRKENPQSETIHVAN
jgi:hypothetical protein